MPELPDIVTYVEALRERVVGRKLLSVRIHSPFVVRTFDPPIDVLDGRSVIEVRHLGKRIVLGLSDSYFVVIHLMVAGRLRWRDSQPGIGRGKDNAGRTTAASRTGRPPRPGKIDLAAFQFDNGLLTLTEASQKKRASIHVVHGEVDLAEHNPGGLDLFSIEPAIFRAALRGENRTLKRALTNPRLFCGVGNAYSDEILHAARLSPITLTGKLTDDEIDRLLAAARTTLQTWIASLRADFAGRFPGPGEITAFRPDFAVHGRYGLPCPVCERPVQRIRYADHETNYCAQCQTGGRVLADRSLSRLLKDDWPRNIEDW